MGKMIHYNGVSGLSVPKSDVFERSSSGRSNGGEDFQKQVATEIAKIRRNEFARDRLEDFDEVDIGFNKKANLYLFFIQKCVRHLQLHGELIFVVPREFATATSAAKLHTWMWKLGRYTHFEDIGDTAFGDASLPCVVLRWQRSPDNRDSHLLADGRKLRIYHGRLQFYDARSGRVHYPLGDTFKVKVGGVSASDDIFTSPDGNIEVVCSITATTGHTKRMLHGDAARRAFALDFVTIGKLRSRGIREFHQDNWWEWGRSWHQSDSPRIYVNCKTRNE